MMNLDVGNNKDSLGRDAISKIMPEETTITEQPAYPSTIYCYVNRLHTGPFKLAAWKFVWRQGKKRIIRKDKSGYLCHACIVEMNAYVFPERK